ncbi:MAG: EutN/CcmL family microcompartment protein [Pseudomonadota bacterium]
MRLARVTGTVTATVKDAGLSGLRLLVVDLVDGAGAVQAAGRVAADGLGAGPGEMVLIVEGSAARMAGASAGVAVDAAVAAIVDQVDLAEGSAEAPAPARPARRKASGK